MKFNDLGVKAGATYKLNGHHYLQSNVAYLEQAPTFQNLFISPRTRDSYIEDPKSERSSRQKPPTSYAFPGCADV